MHINSKQENVSIRVLQFWVTIKPKHIVTILLILSFIYTPLLTAQTVSQYSFSETTSTYSAIAGTPILNASKDNGVSSITNIGFNFVYHGTTYTQFYASTNGFIVLGNVSPSANVYTPVSSLNNCISFFGRNGKTNDAVKYILSGSSPNRVLTIEYPNWFIHYNSTLNKINAQIKLYETTNVIEIIYGPSFITDSYTGQVGLTGLSPDFSNRNTTTDWSATTDGLYNTTTCSITPTTVPADGLTYRWTPPVECSGTPTSGVASISSDLGCADITFMLSATGLPNGLGVNHQWQTSTDGLSDWSDITDGVNPILNTSTSSTAYYRIKSTCLNSGLDNFSNIVSYTVQNCVPASGSNTYTINSGSLYDIGGSNNDYTSMNDGYSVLEPITPGTYIQLEGTYFTESSFDYIYIYDGIGTGGALLGQYTGNGNIPVLTSTDPSGALTIAFTADGSNEFSGFNININTVEACLGAPTPGNTIANVSEACIDQNFNLSLQNQILYSGISYQWQYSEDNISYSDIIDATSSFFPTNQTSAHYYRCLVTSSYSGLSKYSSELYIPMTTICYCRPEPVYVTSDDAIKMVMLSNSNSTSFAQPSASNGITNYDNNTNTPLDLQLGSTTNSLSISFSSNGNQWSAAWIDFNQNGNFESSESIALAATSSGGNSTVTYVFSVPAFASLGVTKMRVRGGSNNAYTDSDACTSTDYGETEDYCVNIIPVYTLSIAGPTSACTSSNIEYSVSANNFPVTPTFQWYYNGNLMPATGGENAPYYSSYSGAQSEILQINTFGTSYSPINWSCVATYNGWSATSNGIDLSVINGTPSTAPTSITITNNNTCNSTSKTLTLVGGTLGVGSSWKWYSGSCGGTYVGTGVSITVSPTSETTYYVRAEGSCNTIDCLSATVSNNPTNDLCENATSIETLPYNSGVQTNKCATNDTPASGSSSCGTYDYNVWYKFVGDGNQISISTCDALTTFDTEIHVYKGSCGSMTEVTCNDDGFDIGCSAGRSSLTICTSNDTIYYISVGSYQLNGLTGNYVLNVTEKAITAATITPNSICGDGTVTLTANKGENADEVEFSIDGGTSVTHSDSSSPYQYTSVSLTAPESVNVSVRSKNSLTGCVGSWTNVAVANAFTLPTATIQSLCNYEGMSRVEILSSGGSGSYIEYQQVSPMTNQPSNRFSLPNSATRSYRVKDSNGCYSPSVTHTSSATPTQIAGATNSGGCLVRNDNSWWHITDASNNVILSIKDNNNNLGNITAWSYIEPTTTKYNDTYYLKRHFKVTSENTPTTNVTLRLYFTDSELSELVTNSKLNATAADDVNDISDLIITRYSGSNEDNVYSNNDFSCPTCFSAFSPNTGTPSTPNLGTSIRYVEISVPGFSEQWIHGGTDASSVLPVQLVSFAPHCNGDDVIIKWITASETNNRSFIIERSLDGVNYTKIAQLDGAGNSNELIEYSYIDNFKPSQLVYYRLSQVDNNGTTKVYEPKFVQCLSEVQNIKIQPNPFKDNITITGLKEGISTIELYNTMGQIVYNITHEGTMTENINLEFLKSGFYTLKITDCHQVTQQFKILKN